ncbi:MAG TPA: hypothetical protein VNA57_04660 [Acidimicrobiales bacterium]|nr:hypothetical protein [Acidimicrobiales bacterium]
MRALVGIETALLVLLSVLVAGLLRSHAEILRELHRLRGSAEDGIPPGVPLVSRARGGQAYDVAGVSPGGDAVHIGVSGRQPTLLAFLSSGCTSCQPLWDGLRRGEPRLPELARVVAVTRGPGAESPGRLAPLSPAGVPVVMSDAAWSDYAVPGSPYVVYVDNGRIAGEGSVQGWDQLRSLLARAGADAAAADRPSVAVDAAGPTTGPGLEQRS